MTPGRRAVERQQGDQVARPFSQVEAGRRRRPAGPAAQEPDAGPAVEQGDRPAGQGRVGQEPDVGQGMIEPAAERAQDDDVARAPRPAAASRASSVSDASLSAGERSIGDAPRPRSWPAAASPSESPSPTIRSRREAEGLGQERPGVGRDRPGRPPSSQPGQAASSSARDGPTPPARTSARVTIAGSYPTARC